MIWGDKRLQNLIDIGMIGNAGTGCVNPASVNMRLGNTFLVPAPDVVKLGEEMKYEKRVIGNGALIPIHPGEFMLATTLESVIIPKNAAAFVQGRSSIGRIGLTVQNAGFIDPGFHGHITLELKNDSPCKILLYPGYPVVQLVYMDACDVTRGYEGKYNDQVEATGSRMQLDGISPKNAL